MILWNNQKIAGASARLRFLQHRYKRKRAADGMCPKWTKDPCKKEIGYLDPCKPQPRVVIIGAGMAGISAANRLAKCGFYNFIILEATGRPGGRIHSCNLEKDKVIELGAQWIQGGSVANPIYSYACLNGLKESLTVGSWSGSQTVYLTSEGRAIESETSLLGAKLFKEIREEASALFSLNCKSNKSLMDFIQLQTQKKLSNIPEELRFDVSRVVCNHINCLKTRWGADVSEMNADQYGSFVSIPGVPLLVKRGMIELLNSLLEDIPPENIKYCKPVQNINWSGCSSSPVQVKCCDGECFAADYCVVTISLGVLKKFSSTLFTPELPDKKLEAIERLEFGCLDKIFLEYNQGFWGRGEGSMRLAWTFEELKKCKHWSKSISSFEEFHSSNDILVTMVAGNDALEMEKKTEQDVAEDVSYIIRRFTGDVAIPFPVRIVRTKWGTDPYFLGSGSYMGKESRVSDQCNLGAPLLGLREKGLPSVLFAGEATAPGQMGTVHGARATGLREAQRILNIVSYFSGAQHM